MVFRHIYTNGVWIDLEHPSEKEVRSIAQEFSISERLEDELFSPSPTSLVASDVDTTFMVLHFPTQSDEDDEIQDQEVDFLVGNGFVITVRYEVVAPLHHLQKLLEAQQLISPNDTMTSDVLLEILFSHIYTAVRDYTTHIADNLPHIEQNMFNGLERVTVRSISNVSRDFLHISASLANQENPLKRFLKAIDIQSSFGPSFEERRGRILSERSQVAEVVETYRAITTELRETNVALLNARQNEIMKTLTVVNFIFLPLELTAFVFGMRAMGTPLENNPNAFWLIIAFMIGLAVILTILFAKKRWIF